MSADRWSICPKCRKNVEKTHPGWDDDDVKNWLLSEEGLGETLREDWEVEYPKEDEVVFGYSCHCKTCGFRHTVDVKLPFINPNKE
jgi:hypothetical protein